jgi:DNA-binding NarL/FixJ family response regulator
MQYAPDLILMDLLMPQLGGWGATREIRQQAGPATIPIIAISASVDRDTRRQSERVGCDGFLSKPVQVDELLALLPRHLPLSWDYGEQAPAATASPRTIQPSETICPPAPELLALLSLAMAGDVSGIEERANALQKEEQKYTPFAMQVTQLTTDFEVTKLEEFIRECLESAK